MRTCTYRNRHNVECCTECGLGIDFCQCVEPDDKADKRLTSVDGMIMKMITDEVTTARDKFPKTTHMLAALVEEVGELSQALMEHDRSQGTSAMAVRIAAEGDDNFLYEFPVIEDELPRGPVGGQYE
jgi:hypothetical protein